MRPVSSLPLLPRRRGLARTSLVILGFAFCFVLVVLGFRPGRFSCPSRVRAKNSAPRRSQTLVRTPVRDKFLISSAIYFGRISNAKISLAEVIGLSLALNRTAVVPRLDECSADGAESGFDGLFDGSSFTRASVVSAVSFDVGAVCAGSAIFVNVGSSFSFQRGQLSFGGMDVDSVSSLELPVPSPLVFSGPTEMDDIVVHAPYPDSFAPGLTSDVRRYLSDTLLPDRLSQRQETCVILGRNFLSLNWARLPLEFAETLSELTPHSSIRANVDEFLLRHELHGRPFLGIHLRMKDFLTDPGHRSFGVECNADPARLVAFVSAQAARHGTSAVVLATDDYNSPCAAQLRRAFSGSLVSLRQASRFVSTSCKAALFDQEVLGASAAFLGDSRSSFSQAIHQVRTLRGNRTSTSTTWL